MPLTDAQRRRYARHIMLADCGEAGQETLARTRVLVIGAGGLGSAVIAYLAAAGIGRIGVVDADHVELSNLQRQIIHEQADIGRLKVDSAADRISELNPDVGFETYSVRLDETNARSLIAAYDIIADGCDNFPTRFAVNDACVSLKKPLVSAAVRGFDGQLATFTAYAGNEQPCYRCLVSELPPAANNCSEVGVIGPLCGVIGSMQALEVIKVALGMPNLAGRLLRYDGITHRQQIAELVRDPACGGCGGACQNSQAGA